MGCQQAHITDSLNTIRANCKYQRVKNSSCAFPISHFENTVYRITLMLSLRLINRGPGHEYVWGNGGIVPHILTLVLYAGECSV